MKLVTSKIRNKEDKTIPHIIILKDFAKKIVEATDLTSKVEANQAASVSGWSTSAINTAMDNLNDFLSDAKSDLEGNIAALEAELPS